MHEVRYLKVTKEEESQRLDNYLLKKLKGVPKSHIYRIIRSGEVRINSKRAQATTRVISGDAIRIPPIRMSDEKSIHVATSLEQRLHKSVLYEDESILVINKPAGLAVHGGSGLSLGLIEAVRKIRTDLHYLELVHRLDRETSGCILLAKKRSMLRALQQLFVDRTIHKTYWAIWCGEWQGVKQQEVVTAALHKNILQSGERMVVVDPDHGKAAETKFQLLKNYTSYCLVEAHPKTGRTHQIRVHSAFLGNPIMGDIKYGAPNNSARLYLHARALEFKLGGTEYKFEAELDEKFSAIINCGVR